MKATLFVLTLVFCVALASAIPLNDSVKVQICNSANLSFSDCSSLWLWADTLSNSVNTTIYINNITNQTIIVNQTIIENFTTSEAQLLREHEFKMKELELRYSYGNLTTSETAKSYTQEELDLKISEAISNANPPGQTNQPSYIPSSSDPQDYLKSPLVWVIIAICGFIGYQFFYKKKELPPPVYQPSQPITQAETREF